MDQQLGTTPLKASANRWGFRVLGNLSRRFRALPQTWQLAREGIGRIGIAKVLIVEADELGDLRWTAPGQKAKYSDPRHAWPDLSVQDLGDSRV